MEHFGGVPDHNPSWNHGIKLSMVDLKSVDLE